MGTNFKARAAAAATAFAAGLPALLLSLTLVFAPPAFADGGGAGSNGSGGAGGTGSATGTGGTGSDIGGTFGAGGGGAGVTGGAGGNGNGGAGTSAAGGATLGAAGANGSGGNGGNGGGGGAHGAVVTTTTTNTTNATGGRGGDGDGGGTGGAGTSGGGGGGEGGYGTAVNAAVTYSNSATLQGGNGGGGGTATGSFRGGQGGDGGFGLATGVAGATISNSGTIAGGNGGIGGNSTVNGAGNGGNGGAGISATSATITNTGTISGGNGGAAGTGGGGTPTNGAGGTGITGSDLTVTNSGAITAGTSGGGAQANAITFTGGTNTLQLQAGSNITGNVVAASAADTLQFGGATNSSFDSSTLGVQYQGFGSYQKLGTSTWTITGTETSTTNWLVSAGTLNVSGSIASSTLTTVANGGTLLGTGTVGATQVNSGGIFSPGTANTPASSMSVNGTLTFAAGSSYQVYLNPTTSSLANVTGTAALNGTVLVSFSGGTYSNKVYTILHSAGLGGSTFSGSTNSNLPAGFSATLTYTTTDADINLTAILGQAGLGGKSLNQNQQYVANAFNNFFNSGGTLSSAFTNVFAMTGSNLTNALAQLTGEAATAAKLGGMRMTTQFMGMMLEPCVDGRLGSGSGCGTGNGGGLGNRASAGIADALLCACDVPATDVPLWTAWGSTFGGSSTTYGNTAMGSNNVTANIFGFAAGMDYHTSPDTIVGFALSGGGTNWTLANALGGGTSESVQAGLYGMTRDGPAYAALGLAFTNHFMKTNRSAIGDQLTANFNAQSYGARAEGGYRFDVVQTETYGLGVTPYAGVQFQDFHTPGYSETDLTGTGFGLTYAANDSTDLRTEVGARLDSPMLVDGRRLVLRAKAAWAHDFVNAPGTSAVFQQLPGSNFIVNGAPIPPDTALFSAGLEYYLTPRLTASAKFDGEFSNGAQSYGGNATLRYTW
jgi:uncharacterized protein with beta-barrel porin domain